jgi:hypothetical protein
VGDSSIDSVKAGVAEAGCGVGKSKVSVGTGVMGGAYNRASLDELCLFFVELQDFIEILSISATFDELPCQSLPNKQCSPY